MNALIDPTTFRHPLLASQERDYVKKALEEIELDQKLGISSGDIKGEVLSKDIDELTRSNDYTEVNKKTIEKLFDIQGLQFYCAYRNILSCIGSFIKANQVQVFFVALGLVVAVGDVMTICASQDMKGLWVPVIVTGIIITGLGAIVAVIGSLSSLNPSWGWEKIEVALETEKLSSTNIRIPYGAKLKTLEAQETGIFEGFAVVHPEFRESRHESRISVMRNLDPAILGITRDKRMFMVVYWDIKKDKERVVADLKRYRKHKLQGV